MGNEYEAKEEKVPAKVKKKGVATEGGKTASTSARTQLQREGPVPRLQNQRILYNPQAEMEILRVNTPHC